MEQSKIQTTHGELHVAQTGNRDSKYPSILLIHGNSSSHRIFRSLFDCPALTQTYHLIALDLLGHGESSNASDPERSYTIFSWAQMAAEVLAHLGIKEVIVVGWSLGGHIGINLIPLLKREESRNKIKGVFLVGTPPCQGPEETRLAFYKPDAARSPSAGFGSREVLSEEEVRKFARATAGPPFEDGNVESVARTDGKARRILFGALGGGKGLDEVHIVQNAKDVLIGVVNGADDVFVNLDYVDGLPWGNLWQGSCVRVEGVGHCVFWERYDLLEPMLLSFLADCEKE